MSILRLCGLRATVAARRSMIQTRKRAESYLHVQAVAIPDIGGRSVLQLAIDATGHVELYFRGIYRANVHSLDVGAIQV